MSAFLALASLFVVVGWTVSVFSVLWRARRTPHEARVAGAAGIGMAAWAVTAIALARAGAFRADPIGAVPPIAINMIVSLATIVIVLALSPTLRGMLSRQSGVIRLQGWRVAGLILLTHTALGHVPLLFGLPAGVGDILVGLTAFAVARTGDTPPGRNRALLWNALGLLDLVVAVTLGVTTSPGPTQVFHTVPDSAMLTMFPLALIPGFAVPLALSLHGVSLWQFLRGSWSSKARTSPERTSYASAQSGIPA